MTFSDTPVLLAFSAAGQQQFLAGDRSNLIGVIFRGIVPGETLILETGRLSLVVSAEIFSGIVPLLRGHVDNTIV
jgi:hypothetical protein